MLLYRLLISLFATAVLLRRGPSRLTIPDPQDGPHVWLHGASNGELASVRPVLERLTAADPERRWLVTANTETARDMVAGWALPRVSARLAPVDLQRVTGKVIRDWGVTAHVSLEAEIWAHRFLDCPGPVILLGARMSEGTARGWGRVPGLSRRVLERVRFASAQDAGSMSRLVALGLPEMARGPVVDLKSFYAPPTVTPPAGFARNHTWLAASTHEGEEAIVLAAHAAAREAEPDLRLILAPRHPRRAREVRAMAEDLGLTVAQRSLGETDGTVYLADTMGEMALWYAAVGRVFVGGTLTDRGGHTPYEPAAFGASLIHGPDVRNFRAAYGRLAGAGAALEIAQPDDLVQALAALADPGEQARMGALARETLRPEAGIETICEKISGTLETG
ncbi:3-deoxy-D-manno-octulosonic acid transferase [Sagittula stellata]|uniref:3-deoxy-D-manno-octulosonic acid transferase n=1 Tax=Sagittula stellata (strain ATCC 700073 / DSM 11524 / E-37) TaxID=388399 RepID=A3K069_SAGS3|nr:glycosyltransferase N-terminal domain-containing protein [Sagittula stellata]EBA09184.1 putative 3-deoxy-D-manno-octulosonic-acid transferase (KDO transferase) [Sagittula stellata E-37]